jgi:hypothetical protein
MIPAAGPVDAYLAGGEGTTGASDMIGRLVGSWPGQGARDSGSGHGSASVLLRPFQVEHLAVTVTVTVSPWRSPSLSHGLWRRITGMMMMMGGVRII